MLFGFLICDYLNKVFYRHKTKHENRNDKSERSEKSVLRTDSDSQLESLMLENELRGSNMSLNSSSSSVSSKSQEPSSIWVHLFEETNGYLNLFILDSKECVTILSTVFTDSFSHFRNEPMSTVDSGTPSARSPISRRTSPVSVPIASRLRQRQESSSSFSAGSWQMITGTGSLRGSDSNSDSNGINGNSNRYYLIYGNKSTILFNINFVLLVAQHQRSLTKMLSLIKKV